jgi:hypothetical protein
MLFSAETSTVAPKILIPITKITHQVLCILEACNAGAKNGQLYFTMNIFLSWVRKTLKKVSQSNGVSNNNANTNTESSPI